MGFLSSARTADTSKASSRASTTVVEDGKASSPNSPPNLQKKKPRCTGSQLFTYCVCGVCFSVIGLVIAIYILLQVDDDDPKPAAMCGDCYCILDENVTSCPDEAPPATYATEMVDALRQQTALNAIPTMKCDAFDDDNCDLASPQPDLGDEAVCGIHYQDETCAEYKIQSYVDRDTAEAQGAFVTHHGACGVCSTTQDLAVYLKHVDLTTEGQRCGTQAMTSFFRGKDCFQDLGFTEACARLWADNARKTGWNCGLKCVSSDLRDMDFNGNAPTCALNDCLQCDEDVSGEVFAKFAGRTRRSSGLRSAIARTCSSMADIRQVVCPTTTALVE
uniref:Uncharacterized protein n=1 Tax=Entomoneis paludosa TaxID=265537 RepID=A0A7S2VCE8_9STRA